MADLTLTPTVYLAAVVEALGAVSGVASARSYGLLEDDAEGPLVLVDLAEVESLDDVDPALWHARLRVELIILAATSTRGSKGDALNTGYAVAHAVRWTRFGLPVLPAQVTLMVRDEVTPLGRAWDAVRVEYTQEVYWSPPVVEDAPITHVFVGVSPDVGIGHEEDYIQVAPEVEDA